LLFVPEHVRGDAEFDGHGPCVRFSLDLRIQDAGSTLLAAGQLRQVSDSGAVPNR
jgi:hypothetical protein